MARSSVHRTCIEDTSFSCLLYFGESVESVLNARLQVLNSVSAPPSLEASTTTSQASLSLFQENHEENHDCNLTLPSTLLPFYSPCFRSSLSFLLLLLTQLDLLSLSFSSSFSFFCHVICLFYFESCDKMTSSLFLEKRHTNQRRGKQCQAIRVKRSELSFLFPSSSYMTKIPKRFKNVYIFARIT